MKIRLLAGGVTHALHIRFGTMTQEQARYRRMRRDCNAYFRAVHAQKTYTRPAYVCKCECYTCDTSGHCCVYCTRSADEYNRKPPGAPAPVVPVFRDSWKKMKVGSVVSRKPCTSSCKCDDCLQEQYEGATHV